MCYIQPAAVPATDARSSVCHSLWLAGHLQDSPCHTWQSPGTLSSLWACMQSSTFPLQLLLGLRSWAGSSVALKVCAGPTLGMPKCTFFSGRLDQAIGCFHTCLRKPGLFPLISLLLLPPSLAKLHLLSSATNTSLVSSIFWPREVHEAQVSSHLGDAIFKLQFY